MARRRENKKSLFSQTEIEAARNLIQLSNSITTGSTTAYSDDNSSSVQWKPQHSNVDDDHDESPPSLSPSSSDVIEDVLADIEEDECLKRRNKRYRYIRDLYQVTELVVFHEPPSKVRKVR